MFLVDCGPRAALATGRTHVVGCGCPNTTMMLLTVNDMATRLQVTEKTIYAWASQGKIPCVKVNGVIRFDERAIEQWLQICQVPVGPPCLPAKNRRTGAATSVDHLIESATRAVYTSPGETTIASPYGREESNGAR